MLLKPDLGLIFWMIIVFGLLFLILKKYGWPIVLKTLKDREEQINKALSAAELAKQDLQDLQLRNQEIMQQAKQERDEILNEARLSGERIIEEARQKAILQADTIVETARKTIHYEKWQAIAELKNQVAKLSIEVSEAILKQELSDKAKAEKTIKEQLDNIKLN